MLTHTRVFYLLGGPERIRTAVQGFADLCLATRPQDPKGRKNNKNYLFMTF